MKNILIISVLCALLSLACLGIGILPEEKEISHEGWICFGSSQDIWVMRTDGSQLQNITSTESIWEHSPMLSWDGSKIVYADINGSLYIVNRNGTGRQQILESNGASFPSWSPNGKEITYTLLKVQDGNGVESIHILNIESKVDSTIYENSSGIAISPVISPDGNKIAFSSDGIYTIGVDGSNMVKILDNLPDQLISDISWSKDGQKIAFHTSYGYTNGSESWAEHSDIYTMNIDGSGLTNLTNSTPDPSIILSPGRNVFQMDFSPKWTYYDQIVFLSNQKSGIDTFKPYIMNSDGSSVELLVDQEVQSMDYQPDIP